MNGLAVLRELEPVLERALTSLADEPGIGEVRTIGMLGGVELAADALEEDPALVEKVVLAARQRGVLVRNLLGRALQISPPFVITEDEIQTVVDVIRESLGATLGTAEATPAVRATEAQTA